MASRTVDIPQDVQDALKKFRFKKVKGLSALSVKIVKKDLALAVDEELDVDSVEEVADELPENAPRYVLISYELKHKDGRISNPLLLVNWAPPSSPIDLMTLHASALSYFQQAADVGKVLEVRDGAEGLTTQAVEDRLLA
ncbi:hypothetical protein BD324DRAFT_633654 [Kockovaella imperatae]|uniref:ADF-H domain-containing protein n=1 Tax=Kockovaella imperatae TaxID=4999 RepID=A0A1Y1UAG7_9TREE|nr:hypothetical protein BD324DRAFT_633654 [Kockovaella imperatae]ORX35030.1 hypothetical protein BD324DRAFT_633654 [Kockovaella imperatae]